MAGGPVAASGGAAATFGAINISIIWENVEFSALAAVFSAMEIGIIWIDIAFGAIAAAFDAIAVAFGVINVSAVWKNVVFFARAAGCGEDSVSAAGVADLIEQSLVWSITRPCVIYLTRGGFKSILATFTGQAVGSS